MAVSSSDDRYFKNILQLSTYLDELGNFMQDNIGGFICSRDALNMLIITKILISN